MSDRCPTDVKYEFHGMGYQSPVEQIYKNMEVKLEGDIYKQVMYYGVHVDKDELMKALKYDRDQYKKGFFDGLAAQRKRGRWVWDKENDKMYCSECGYETENWGVHQDQESGLIEWQLPNYCENCGAKMEVEE